MACMKDAEQIFDIAARHSFVFDSGLCSPDFFDVEKRMASEEFGLIRERCSPGDRVLEVGCLTGLNLIGLRKTGHTGEILGIDFVSGALEWLLGNDCNITTLHGIFGPRVGAGYNCWDKVICFDVLEHQLNAGDFLDDVESSLTQDGRLLLLVPKGREYHDCGHVAWFPDEECLSNLLGYYFDVEEVFELKSCKKLFACCKRKTK